MRKRLQKEYGTSIVFTATLGVRGTKEDGTKTVCLNDVIYKGEKVDSHLWVIYETDIPKGSKVCVHGDIYCYDDFSNYGVKPILLLKVPDIL